MILAICLPLLISKPKVSVHPALASSLTREWRKDGEEVSSQSQSQSQSRGWRRGLITITNIADVLNINNKTININSKTIDNKINKKSKTNSSIQINSITIITIECEGQREWGDFVHQLLASGSQVSLFKVSTISSLMFMKKKMTAMITTRGKYSCTASTSLDSMTSSTELRVLSDPPKVTSLPSQLGEVKKLSNKNDISIYRAWFFNCSSQFSVPK